ncbi:MAG: DNA mismatch repair endonuclease MutL, partial [Planctomycetes bacterium]|nr:DNA mismatch repair endonuclease MutL [Planctomycetota bacterium]
MTEIRVLPEVVQNKIAAGEVVERPASVVKELVENAIDAGASEVTVEIAAGGAELIRVTDDGRGMGAADLALAVERHATSKIRDIDDIFHIHTLGFRGEALPSIGSVARLTIATATPGAAEGAALTVEGGKRQAVRPAPPRRGTVVEVSNLFFNTPARRKFMKSPAAEVAAAGEVITRLALAHPEVAFRLDNNGRRSLELPAAPDLETRIAALFGKMALLPVDHDSAQGVKITGFIAEPPESRSQSRFIYTLLNGRWFRHPGIARAVADACAGNLPPRRYPFAVLCFAIDTERVDVNAHPAKEVIRFENEALIVGGASHAVREALARRHFAGAPAPD